MNDHATELYAHKLSLLGGRVTYSNIDNVGYIDLEEFFLDSTVYVFKDSRLANCIEHWIRTYAYLIAPSKVKKLIVEGYKYDKAALGVFLELIENSKNEKQIKLDILKKYAQEKEALIFRNEESHIRYEWRDPLWLKYNIVTRKFYPEFSKNLVSPEILIKKRPEIKLRVIGCKTIDADIQAFYEAEGSISSIRQISQTIHAHYSNVHKVATRLLKFGIIKIRSLEDQKNSIQAVS